MMRMSLPLKYWMRMKTKLVMLAKVKKLMVMMPVVFSLEMVRCTGTLTQVGCALGLTQVEGEVLQGHRDVVEVVGGEGDVGGCEGVEGEVGSGRSLLETGGKLSEEGPHNYTLKGLTEVPMYSALIPLLYNLQPSTNGRTGALRVILYGT
eukprot:TRINITY_DN16700_c0_g1_i2.p1 TRINITY_DN16700_c0_g1~~TRINITY_DN16700_c0_g1_i2.p1  ORF type:complete len:150 (-),score=18.42 TRINITY_DN16700_c0_g1_i2:271-720(-)